MTVRNEIGPGGATNTVTPGLTDWKESAVSDAICSIEGCANRVLARGWCNKHWKRWRNHGDPERSPRRPIQERMTKPGATLIDLTGQRFGRRVVLRRAERDGKPVWWEVRCDCGQIDQVPGHSLKAGKSQQCRECQAESRHVDGYGSTHDRLRRGQGKASNYLCAHCGDLAKEWALRHDASERLRDEFKGFELDYSRNLADYKPLCTSCHRTYDHEYRVSARAARRDEEKRDG